MIILHILLWIFLILVALLLLIFFVPIRYQVHGTLGEKNEIMAKVKWLFLKAVYENSDLSIKIGPYQLPFSIDNLQEEEEREDKPSSFTMPKLNLAKLNIKSIASLGIILLKKLWRRIKPKFFYVKGIVGFSDPCTTGQFIGFYEVIANSLGFRPSVDLQGDFCDNRIDLDIKMAGGFAVASLAWPALWFIWQKPVRDGIKLLRKGDEK